MTAILVERNEVSIFEEIQKHPAWKGRLSGLTAEKLLRGRKTPYLYLLRAGEFESENAIDYYVTFIAPDLSIHHQAFVITNTAEGWSYEQGGNGGPYTKASINDVLHLIMHCHKDACMPLKSFA